MVATPAVTATKTQIRSSLSRWRGKLSDEKRPLFKSFVEQALERLRGPFLAQHHPNQVLQYLEIAFEFAYKRDPEEVKVRVRPGPSKGLVLLTCMEDQPFIVDTCRLFLRNGEAEYWGGFNIVLQALRDDEGHLIAVGDPDGVHESMVLLEGDRGTLLEDAEASTRVLRSNLELARAMVQDFKPMVRAVERMVEKFEVRADQEPDHAEAWRETASFLKWLLRENFVFMGMEDGEELGIQRIAGPCHGSVAGPWPPPHEPMTVQARKSRCESPVHRAGRIDEILVTLPGRGDREDHSLFVRGMFTYRAVTQPSRNVPILRRVLGGILEEQQSRPGSFRYKGIANVFDSLPTEFLFTASRQAIADMVDLVFESEQQQEVGVTFLMTGPDSAFCLVAMPKSQYGENLRRELEKDIVDTLQATYSDHGLFIGRYDTVLLHYYLTGVVRPSDEALQSMTERIRQLATPWLGRLWHSLSTIYGEQEADRLAETYGRAFPEDWIQNTRAERAVHDIEHLEQLSGGRNLVADVFRGRDDVLVLRLYQATDVYLTQILPILDDFGIVVIDSYATQVRSRGGRLHMDTFRLLGADGVSEEQLLERAPLLVDAIEAVFADQVESDPLNKLVLSAGVDWREVDVIRGYTRYSRQLQIKLAVSRVQEILLSHPDLCCDLVSLFHARFDPDLEGNRKKQIARYEEKIRDTLRGIRAHDEDMLFSAILGLISGTLRTNYYRTDRPFHYLSFKLDCSKIKEMGQRRPTFEIYVHHRDVEGVHLRFGKVARGGLRWSDREDYRTEILGLATTQVVKNVVIVPVGAKGGFYLKNPSRDPATRRQEADTHYKTFIRGLLDVTDNSVGGAIHHPPRVVPHDGDDAYLVVAADKGTAHLSDTANAISQAYGFWLGDAFASGGSNGYDHKKVAITARGAWVLVRRHFAEMGVDPYAQPFTAIGVGDMSGDVFGNGFLETPHVKLLAAFNHLHVFLDPDPDPTASFDERKRLFEAGRQGEWAHYDPRVISKGGGVFDRRVKSIPLSPEAQRLLGIEKEEADPDEVVKHILMMDADLLWNGGIGTYVKASFETHADADDRSNDAVRIDATQLRARIVGEGGNLGFTSAARIEAARRGVRLNTDFIDNSGGVDMSDHEVNLKILLDRVVERGELTVEARNTLLAELTEEVAELVLRNNDAHGRQISRDQIRSREDVFQFNRAIAFLERVLGRSREELDLPEESELDERIARAEGLTRPELARLSAWVKMYVYRELMAGSPGAIPGYQDLLLGYFPKAIQERYREDALNHMLADEIAMTVATTELVADGGAAMVPMLIETSGRSVQEIATAYFKSQVLARTDEVRSTLEQMRATVSLDVLYRGWVDVDKGAREVAAYWLSARGRIPTDEELSEMLPAVEKVYQLQASEVTRRNRELLGELAREEIPEDVAHVVLKAQYLNTALMVWAESRRTKRDLAEMIVQNLAVARASRLQEVVDHLAKRPAFGRWDPIAINILRNRYNQLLRSLVLRLPMDGGARSVDELAPRLARGALADVRAQVEQILRGDEPPAVAALLVLEERIAAAIARLPTA